MLSPLQTYSQGPGIWPRSFPRESPKVKQPRWPLLPGIFAHATVRKAGHRYALRESAATASRMVYEKLESDGINEEYEKTYRYGIILGYF